MKSRLRLARGKPLRDGILAAFANVLRVPRRCAAAATEKPVEAVHEYRKSIRRARALLSLLRPAIGKTAHKGLLGELKGAFGETSSLRDADVLLATLRALPAGESDGERKFADEALEAEIASARDSAAIAKVLHHGSARLKPLPAALGVILPQDFSVREIEAGLERAARRVADTLATARRTAKEEDFHEWRKAVKELRYQVELLSWGGSRKIKAREKDLGDLAKSLGDATDLAVLRRELSSRQVAGTMPATPTLLALLEARATEERSTLLERGAALLSEKPAPLARTVLAERG
jgi:CHAD domain-containing protein